MTAPKASLTLPSRTPAFVSREIGAAELCISPSTWDNWVSAGILPEPAPGLPTGAPPRWRWAEVEARLAGTAAPVGALVHSAQVDTVDPFIAAARSFGDGQKKGRKRGLAA